jgi:polysaccharide biosynthesis protein PslH
VVFVGLMNYRPNLDAARYLVDDIFPRVQQLVPAATLTIVGTGRETDLAPLRQPGVTVTGWVRDVRPYMREAAVLVAPLRIGGGTRLKVVEGMAMARPMVSTSLGCEGLDVEHGEHLLIGDDAEAFAEHVARLLGDADLGRRLGRAGRALAHEKYTWQAAARQLDALYGQVLTQPASERLARIERIGEHAQVA